MHAACDPRRVWHRPVLVFSLSSPFLTKRRRGISTTRAVGCALLTQTSKKWRLHYCKDTLLISVDFALHFPCSFCTQLLLRPPLPRLYGLAHPRCMALHLSPLNSLMLLSAPSSILRSPWTTALLSGVWTLPKNYMGVFCPNAHAADESTQQCRSPRNTTGTWLPLRRAINPLSPMVQSAFHPPGVCLSRPHLWL